MQPLVRRRLFGQRALRRPFRHVPPDESLHEQRIGNRRPPAGFRTQQRVHEVNIDDVSAYTLRLNLDLLADIKRPPYEKLKAVCKLLQELDGEGLLEIGYESREEQLRLSWTAGAIKPEDVWKAAEKGYHFEKAVCQDAWRLVGLPLTQRFVCG